MASVLLGDPLMWNPQRINETLDKVRNHGSIVNRRPDNVRA
jgi:hypothetical protein